MSLVPEKASAVNVLLITEHWVNCQLATLTLKKKRLMTGLWRIILVSKPLSY